MGAQYFCHNENRRQEVDAHATLNGIDYLEVLDGEAPKDDLRQRILLVRCLKPLASELTADNVHVEGGVRVTPVNVMWARRGSDAGDLFDEGLISAEERDFYLGLPEPDHLFLVHTDSTGDYSAYTLRLVASSATSRPPADFDILLSSVEFSFKVECPTDFDCKPEEICPPEYLQPPAIDYLAKDYASFRQLMLDRLSAIMPAWEERSPADMGIALVELLAYAGDYLSYYQDAAATEAYLGTARRRSSIRRHARLLDYSMHDGCNARTWVHFTVDGPLHLTREGPTGAMTRLLTHIPEGTVISPDQWAGLQEMHAPEVFELMHNSHLYPAHNEIRFHTWGDEECCLPKGATRATLQDNEEDRLLLRPGDILVFEEKRSPKSGEPEMADPAHRHAVRLTHVTPQAGIDEENNRIPTDLLMDELLDQPIVEIEWHAEDALPFPFCISEVIDGEHIEDISIALGNMALVDHGQTIPSEELPLPEGHRQYRPSLDKPHITHRDPYQHDKAQMQSAQKTIAQNERKALPEVSLTTESETWIPRQDLLGSDSFDTNFIVETENDGSASLRFGDGTYGRPAPGGERLEATYRVGSGTAGNVGAEAINHVVTDRAGILSVRNPLPALGGIIPEPLEEVRLYAPHAFRTQERAVTEEDYARVTERHPGVQQAQATRRWTGSWHTMFITVDRKGGRPVDESFEVELRRFLSRFRLAGQDVEIDAPRFVPLEITIIVCVRENYFRSDVKHALLKTFSNQTLPDGRKGFFHPDHFTFGQPVYLSQLIAKAMEVAGVKWVEVEEFKRWGERPSGELEGGSVNMARLEIARLANDPNAPEDGKIEFVMEGGV